jgi:hypothetical protein
VGREKQAGNRQETGRKQAGNRQETGRKQEPLSCIVPVI